VSTIHTVTLCRGAARAVSATWLHDGARLSRAW